MTRNHQIAQALEFTRRTAGEVLGGEDELTDGTGDSVGIVAEARIGPYRRSS